MPVFPARGGGIASLAKLRKISWPRWRNRVASAKLTGTFTSLARFFRGKRKNRSPEANCHYRDPRREISHECCRRAGQAEETARRGDHHRGAVRAREGETPRRRSRPERRPPRREARGRRPQEG